MAIGASRIDGLVAAELALAVNADALTRGACLLLLNGRLY